MPDKIRIGAVSYLNTRPLVLGLEKGLGADRITLSYGHPAALADRMEARELDIGLLPIIELARIRPLELVRGLSISTFGPCRSVLLVANKPIDQVRRVALDIESRTSNALIQVLFSEFWCVPAEFAVGPRVLAESLTEFDATVRIGDKALFDSIPEGLCVYDMGEVWTEATGLPFVFAAWAARPGMATPAVCEILQASLRLGATRIDEIASEYRWNGRKNPELCRDYLSRHIRFDLGEQELLALRQFLALAEKHGLIDSAPDVELAGQLGRAS